MGYEKNKMIEYPSAKSAVIPNVSLQKNLVSV